MKLSSIIDRDLIFLDYHFESYPEIIDFIVEKMAAVSRLERETLREAFLRRENQGTTYIGHRLILPHGYVDTSFDTLVLFIRLEKELGVIVDNRRRSVKYVFAVITSKHKVHLYLKVLKSIAYLVTNYTYLLNNAPTAVDLLNAIDQKEMEVEDSLTALDIISVEASVRPFDHVSKAVRIMENNGMTILPVTDEQGVFQGIVELTDLFAATYPRRMIDPENLWLLYEMGPARERMFERVKRQWEKDNGTEVKEVMKPGDHDIIDANAHYIDIVNHMASHRRRFLVVLDADKKVRGMIDSEDLVHRMIKG